MDSPKTLESILAPGIFSAVVEFLDDTALTYLKYQNTSLNTRISAEQESNAYWKSRVARRFFMPIDVVTGLNWKNIYRRLKTSDFLEQIVIELFPRDFVVTYLEHQLKTSVNIKLLGYTIYKLVLEFDRVDIYDTVRQLLIHYKVLRRGTDYIKCVVKSSNSLEILKHLIPEIITNRDTSDNPKIFIVDFCSSAAESSNCQNFILVDTQIVPSNFKSQGRILRRILRLGNLEAFEYYYTKYSTELSKNFSQNLISCEPKYSVAKFVISRMSDSVYSNFLNDILEYIHYTPLSIWEAVAKHSRTPRKFIYTHIKPHMYNSNEMVRNTRFVDFAKFLKLNTSELLNCLVLSPANPIPTDLLIYLVTSSQISLNLREYFNELLNILHIPIELNGSSLKKLSRIEALNLGNYLINIANLSIEDSKYFRSKIL